MNNLAEIVAESDLPASSSLSLTLPADLPFERWQDIGRELAAREKVLNWWIGDWWNHGIRAYGEARAAASAAASFGGYEMVRQCGWVAGKFEDDTRVPTLSFTHHREVAALAPAEAAALLRQASEGKGLSTREIKSEATKLKVASGETEPREVVDPEYQEFLALARAWNFARVSVREDFAFILTEIGTKSIEL